MGWHQTLRSSVQRLLVHSPRAVPAPSQTLTSLHVLFLPLSCGYSQLETLHHGGSQGFAATPLGSWTSCFRSSLGALQMLSWTRGGMGTGRGAGTHRWEGPGEGRRQFHLPLGPWAFFASPLLVECGFPPAQLPCRQQTPNHLSPAPAAVPVSHESWVGAEHGHRGGQNHLPNLHQSRVQAHHYSHSSPATYL